jgi:hypothetical protein
VRESSCTTLTDESVFLFHLGASTGAFGPVSTPEWNKFTTSPPDLEQKNSLTSRCHQRPTTWDARASATSC